jgi:hypothetical protein
MQITICIDTSTDAFQEQPEAEVRVVLNKVLARFENGSAKVDKEGDYEILDTNGNVCATLNISRYI